MIDAPAPPEQQAGLRSLTPAAIRATDLGGDPIESILHAAPGNGQPIGGVKVIAAAGWFTVRPSGTEPIYELYAESFRDQEHLRRIEEEARATVAQALSQEKR